MAALRKPVAEEHRRPLLEDNYQLNLPAEAPAGTYLVEIGLYDPETFDRLQVNFSDKGIVLGRVKVVPR